MNKLLHALYLLPLAAIAIYLISEGKPALIAFGIALIAFDLFILLSGLWKKLKSGPKSPPE